MLDSQETKRERGSFTGAKIYDISQREKRQVLYIQKTLLIWLRNKIKIFEIW